MRDIICVDDVHHPRCVRAQRCVPQAFPVVTMSAPFWSMWVAKL